MNRFITIYPVENFIAYKQNPDFLRYLAYRDGFVNATSEAHYYIVHHQKELIDKPAEIIERGLIRHYIYVPSAVFSFGLLFAWRTIIHQWRNFDRHEQILVINNTFHHVGLHFLARLARWRSLKIFGTFFYHARHGWKKNIVTTMEWLHGLLATKIMVISPSGWEYVPKRFHNKTHYYIPNFLHDAPTNVLSMTGSSERNTPYSAICLSRLEPEKGLTHLIDAWKKVDARWHLTIYGDGSLKTNLLERIHRHNLSDRITIKDPILHAEVFTTLLHNSVFILTSPCEGLGISYLEALYMKVPCVGLNVPGVRDTLGEGRGILLAPATWQTQLAVALDQAVALGTSEQWQRMIEKYFTTTVIPRINPGTSVWFEEPNKK